MHAVHDWANFFAPLGLQISGLTPTHREPVVNHSWRVIRRGDLGDYSDKWDVHVPEDFVLVFVC